MTEINKKPDPVDVHVGERVRARRKMLGLSQTELGEQIGVTFQQVQKYERGTNRIGSSRLFRMSQILDVQVSYFFEGVDAKMPGFLSGELTDAQRKRLDGEIAELNSAFTRISDPHVRRSLVGHANCLAGSYPAQMGPVSQAA